MKTPMKKNMLVATQMTATILTNNSGQLDLKTRADIMVIPQVLKEPISTKFAFLNLNGKFLRVKLKANKIIMIMIKEIIS